LDSNLDSAHISVFWSELSAHILDYNEISGVGSFIKNETNMSEIGFS
jgi:hypothetical protein